MPAGKSRLVVTDRVVQGATYDAGGLAMKILHCPKCGYHKREAVPDSATHQARYRRYAPRETRSLRRHWREWQGRRFLRTSRLWRRE